MFFPYDNKSVYYEIKAKNTKSILLSSYLLWYVRLLNGDNAPGYVLLFVIILIMYAGDILHKASCQKASGLR